MIELLPLRLSDLADYLPRTTRKVPAEMSGEFTTKWDPVLRCMRTEPGDPACRMLLEVLSTPLMASLARSVYSDTAADPAILLNGNFADCYEIEAHLLDGFIPAAFAGPVTIGSRQQQRSAQDAERWLSFLARHLDLLGTRDLEWWRLQNAVPPPVRWLALGLVVWLYLGAGSEILGGGPGWTAAACVAAGLILSLALVAAKLPQAAQGRTAGRLRLMLRPLCYIGAAAVPAGVIIGLDKSLNPGDPFPGGVRGQIIVLAYFMLEVFAAGAGLAAAGVDAQAPTTTPLRLRRRFRTLSRRLSHGISHGVLNGLLVGMALWVAVGLGYSAAAALRIVAAPSFPPGGSMYRLPGGGSYADYPDGLRYVISGKGDRYIVTIRKAAFYVGNSDEYYYLSLADCLANEERQCHVHSPEIINYIWNGGHVSAVSLPDDTSFSDSPSDPGARITAWLNPPQFSEIISGSAVAGGEAVYYALLGGLIGGFFLWLGIPADVTRAISPLSTLRTDRNAVIFRAAATSSLILLTFATVTLFIIHPRSHEFERIAEAAVLWSVTLGLLTLTLSTWLRLQVARLWLADRGQAPWHVMRFLEEAHARGALRQVGAAYQFRHARLQGQLAARANETHRRRSTGLR